jgi:GT2 family glycosyltransferase
MNKPTLALVVPVINLRNNTIECLNSFRDNADNWGEIELLIVDNGSKVPASKWGLEEYGARIIRNNVNIGVLPAMHVAYLETKADYIFYTHNDVTMYEKGWDTKIRRVLTEVPNVGVAGFFGSKGIGTQELYEEPYEMEQLVRWANVSNCTRMDPVHGFRPIKEGDWEKVAVVDGFSMIVSRKFLDENGGFDLNLPPHHNYDNHTCLQAIDNGYTNIVIAMDAYHQGGQTDVSTNWNEPFGKTKLDIHKEAHYPYYYNYWRPDNGRSIHLPYNVIDDK